MQLLYPLPLKSGVAMNDAVQLIRRRNAIRPCAVLGWNTALEKVVWFWSKDRQQCYPTPSNILMGWWSMK